jgi:uncharacterized protein YfaS (alpha-2-macroglobulin family)
MSAAEKRELIPGWRTMGNPISIPVRVVDANGEPVDLLVHEPTLLVTKPDGTEATAAIEPRSPQQDVDKGMADVTVEAEDNDQEGDWELDVYVEDEDLPMHHWKFKVVDTTPVVPEP